MFRLLLNLITLGALFSVSMAEIFTLTLGDMKQYSGTLAVTPTIPGSRIIFTNSPSPSDGVDLILSEELRGKVGSTLESACVNLDDACFESINGLIVSPQTELEARQIGVAGLAIAFLLAAYLPIAYQLDKSKGVPVVLHAPLSQIKPVVSAANAPTLALAIGTGTPTITITRKPDEASITASDAPHQTTFSSSTNGYSPGDIEIYIPELLGQRMTELIDRSQQCTIESSVSGTQKTRSLEFGEQLTGVICSTKQVLLNASPGAAFDSLHSLAKIPSDIPFWLLEDVQKAMTVVIDYAVLSYQYLGMDEGSATTMAAFIFTLIYQRALTGKPIFPSIRIPGDQLQGKARVSLKPSITTFRPTISETSTGSSSSSSSTQECSAYCTMIGQIKKCTTECPKTIGLPTAAPTEYAVRTMTVEPWIVPYQPQIPMQNEFSFCMPNEDTKFPVSSFNATYSGFCEKADGSNENVTWMVNSKGEESQLSRRRFWRRENSDELSDYKFALWWRPKIGANDTDCAFSCVEAFQGLTENDSCKVGDDKKFLAGGGGIDIGCGTYSFTVYHHIQSTINCLNHPLDAPKNDQAASGGVSVESAIQTWCSDNNGHQFSSNSIEDNVYWRWGVTQLDVSDRRSFWLRAKPNGNHQQASFVKEECIAALTEGLSKCDSGSDNSHGFTASVGTIDYSLDLSGVTNHDSPPWNEHPSFPAPEQLTAKGSTKPQAPGCLNEKKFATGRKVFPNDLESAIDAWCIDNSVIEGWGQYGIDGPQFPPPGETPFYPNAWNPMHIHLAVRTVENGAPEPYEDMNWCQGYNWRMGRDDCRYALRRLFKDCNTIPDQFRAGEYTYRCVTYKVWSSNDAH